MAVERVDVIDAIGTEKDSGRVVLSLLDQLPFDEEMEHPVLLQEKLNRYLGFIESGEILTSYPDAKGRNLSKRSPDGVKRWFLYTHDGSLSGEISRL